MDDRDSAQTERQTTPLKRSISLPMIVFYGLGTTIGAGIYVLIGKVAATAGIYMTVSFVVASLLAVFTVFSFSELTARFPRSAGEAVYMQEGFGIQWFSLAIGLCVMFAGLVSSAAISRGFIGYLHEFFLVSDWLAIILLVGALGALAAWGITESVSAAVVATLVEVGGLIFVIWVSRDSFSTLPERLPELLPPFNATEWGAILAGSILAFYAFIGFEDMVNVAEEVTDARRNLPRAMILTLAVTTVFYLALALAATLSLPVDELAASKAPLALLVDRHAGPGAAKIISLVALIAVLNGALVQIIMAARVIYGLACQGWLPSLFARVHSRFQTPLIATALVTACVMVFALWLPLAVLAEITSFLTLFVFAAVNLALYRVKCRTDAAPGLMTVPIWVPIVGFLASAGIMIPRIFNLLAD